MIKIRLMGKKEDMHEMIKRIYQIKDIEVMELSDFYTNKGTSKYGRIYMEVEQRKQKWGIMQLFGYEQVAKQIANIRLTRIVTGNCSMSIIL